MDQPKKGKPHASATKANDRQVGGDHYATEDGIQHWDLFGPDYLIGYATKYMRWRKKGGVEDLEKAIHVVEKLIELYKQRTVTLEQIWPRYSHEQVVEWCDAVGLDWVERQVVSHIMLSESDRVTHFKSAIDGVRYLITSAKRIAAKREDGGVPIVNYNELDKHETHELYAELARLTKANAEATGWGAAVGARCESIRDIQRALERRKPRIPRLATSSDPISLSGHEIDTPSCGDGTFDTRQRRKAEQLAAHYGSRNDRLHEMGMRLVQSHPDTWRLMLTEENSKFNLPLQDDELKSVFRSIETKSKKTNDAAQHASLFPWCMSKDQWQATFAGRIQLAETFYLGRGLNQKVLDAAVVSEKLPRELAACYDLHRHHANGATVWVIKIENVPADLRDNYPHLRRELNLKEWECAPDWHRLLYRWEESDAKFHLTMDAWTRDE